MSYTQQLRITLWKDYLLRKRKPGVIFLSCFCAVAFFSILLGVRLSLPPEQMPTCQFRPRAMPSVGLIPFAQSFICSIGNECLDEKQYEEYPALEDSQMAAIVSEMQPLLQDETFIRISKSLPKGVDLITVMADILSYPDIQKLLVHGIGINELFKNPEKLRNYWVNEMQIFDDSTFDAVLEARLNIVNVIKSFNPTNDDTSFRSEICDINNLNKYLIMNDSEQLNIISTNLCQLNSTLLRKAIVTSLGYINFGDILRMFGRVMVQLGHPDVFTNIGNMVDSLGRMQEFQQFLPTNFTSLAKLLPEILPLFQSINSSFIDFNLIQQVIEIIDPAMDGVTPQWSTIKRLSMHVSTLLKLIQDKMLKRQPIKNSTDNIADLYQNLRMDILMLQLGAKQQANITENDLRMQLDAEPKMTTKEILGLSWKIANNTGSILDDIIIENNTEPLMLVAKVLDEVKLILPFFNLFKEKTVIFNNILSLVNDLLIISTEGKDIVYRLSEKHSDALNVIVRLGPNAFNNLSKSLQDPDKVNVLLSNLNSTYDLFCSDENIMELFGVTEYTQMENIKFDVCSSTWLKFVEDIISELGFLEIGELLKNLNRKSSDMTIDYYNDWSSDSFYRLYLNGKKIFDYIAQSINDDVTRNQLDWTKLNRNFSSEEWQPLISDKEQDFVLQTIRLKLIQNGIENLNVSQENVNLGLVIIENLLDDLQQKLKILFVKNDTEVYDILEPMILENMNASGVAEKQNYLWKRLLIQEKNLYTVVRYLFQHKIKMFNFVNYEHFQDSFQQYWSSNIDLQTAFELCIQTITKLLEFIDIKFDSVNPNIVWARLKSFILSLNEILAFFDNILNKAIENEKVDMSDIFHENLPKTQAVFTSLIVNLPVIINDFGKSLIDFDPNTEEIDIFMQQIPGWPCSKISLADLFKLENQSSTVIREFEVSVCDNTILNEIKNSKIFSKILKTWKIFDHHNVLTDWRKVSELFHDIIMKTEEIKNGPKVKLFTDIPEFDENKIVTVWNSTSIKYHNLHPDMEFYRKNLQILDAMFNKAPKPTIPLSEIENNYVTCTDAIEEGNPTDENCDETLYNDIKNNLPMNLLRFFPTVIVQVNNYLSTYLEELSTNNATILQVMGFTRTSGPQLFYEHLTDYILIFVHSFQQPAYQNIFKRSQSISCKKIFKYLTIPEGNPLTMNDIYRLGNYSCLNFLHVEVMEENLILLAGQVPQILYYETYDTYNRTYEDVADSVIKLNDLAKNLQENNMVQQTLFVPEWTEKLKNAGYYILNNVSYSTNSSVMNILNYYYQNTTWFEYLITVVDSIQKLSNSIQSEIQNENSTSLEVTSTVATDRNQINSFRVLGYNLQTFIIEQFILRDDCNVTNNQKQNKIFLNESKLICSFDLSGIRKDLGYYYGNETKLYLNDFIIETAFQDIIRTIIHLVKDGENSKLYLSSLALWQKVLYKLIPDMDKIQTEKFASYLYDTYKTHNISDKLLKSIDDNHQLYISTLNGFKGDMHFEEPNINTKSAVELKKSDFEKHVVQLQESLLFILKNPKLLSFFNTSITTDNFGNETQAVDKGIEIFHSVTQQINYLLDLSVYIHKDDEECKWCRIATTITKEATYQISHFRRYVMLVCQLKDIQFNDLYNMLLNEFKWKDIPKKLADQKTQYNFVDFTTAIRDFFATTSVQITLAQSTGLFDQLTECAKDLGNTASVKNMKIYFKLFMDVLKFMGSSSEHINELMSLEKKITPMFTYLQDKIQVVQPMNVIVIDTYPKRIKENGYSDADITKILNTNVYVNRLLDVNETQNTGEYEKLLKADTIIPYKIGNHSDYRQVMIEEINWKLIDQQLSKWQHDRIWNFEWLSDILDKFDEIFENGNRIMDFEKNISFQKIDFNDLNIVDLLESILQFLQKSSQDMLIRSLNAIKNDLKPLTENSVIEDDLENISNGFQAVSIFVKDGFIPWTYNVSDLFNDWSEVSDYFKDNFNLDEDNLEVLKNSQLNLRPILMEEKRLLNLKGYLCDAQKYNDMLLSNSENKTQLYKKLSEEYCSLDRNQTKQLYTFLIQHLNISTLFDSFIQTTMNNILSKANITQDEIKEIFSNLKEMKDLIPKLQEKFKNVTKIFNKNKTPPQSAALVAEESDNGVDFLADASTLICGRPLIQTDMHVLKALSVNTEPLKVINPEDYNDLPTPFCKELYVNILQMEAGKILWTYLKPIVRGRIVYSPKTVITDNIMNAANFTFNEIFEFEKMLLHLSSGSNSVRKLIHNRKAVQELEVSIKTPMMADLLSMVLGDENINLEEMKLQQIIEEFQGSEKMMNFVNITHELMKCIRKDRMVGVNDETELENLALSLSNKRELIGAVVFTEIIPNSNNNLVPKSVKYKIRMDVDDVPSTNRLRDLYWSPGAEADFIEDLRYFRGFIQIQNMLDQGIIGLQSKDNSTENKYEIYTQQFPYACWRKDSFVWSLYASQGFQACFFLALIGMVGTSIRYLIKERETRNTSLMKIMGLRMGVHYISWFISSIIEMTILMTISYFMFVYGDVFPYSNLLIVYVFLLSYGFSVIMFSYMFSPLFKAASAASITVVMLYYLTYMPYIISYTCEAVLSLWQKVIINLFMSSAFSTSVLYMLRYEVQTIGINSDTFWTSPLQGDNMNFGISFFLVILDGILYGIIGYILTKYLTDIPNIKTTAIVAHNQGNSTSNAIPASVGVVIQNITKVYNTGKVALDNVNIQLYKGQITTLLGQNGAGKTTLINILTGMASPTKGQIIINDPTYSNLKLKRQYLGVCPQFSILLDTLTTREHLMFYAQLKSELPAKDVEEGVDSLIESMGLGLLANEPVQKLSEGTRRRVSVAIAFTYGPSLVVLDEPSSGVDPVARRQIWDLIIKHKKNRTILLTTHHFDEADLLSDRIIILHKGKIHCSGTPLYLKENFGKGYQLDVTYYPDNEKIESIETNRSNDLLKALKEAVENISVFEIVESSRIIFDLPFLTSSGVPNNFEKAALILEQQKSKLGIEDYAFNCTTLEKVFVDICCKADIMEDSEHTKLNIIPNINTSSLENIYFGNNKPNSIAENDFKLAPNKEILTHNLKHINSHKTKWYDQFMPLFKKRAIHYIHDKKALFCTLVLPTLIAAIAMGLTLLRPPTVDEPSIDLNPNLYDMSTNFLSYDPHFISSEIGENILNDYGEHKPNYLLKLNYTSQNCECTDMGQVCLNNVDIKYPNPKFVYFWNEKEASNWIIETQNKYIEKRYGGWSVKSSTNQNFNETLTVWYNNKGHHSAPSYTNRLSNAILKSVCDDCSISTYSHPLKFNLEQLGSASIRQHVADVGIALVLLCAYSLAITCGVLYIIGERKNEEKRLQYLSGVSPNVYWIVSFVWDYAMFIGCIFLSMGVYEIFKLPVFTARLNLAGHLALLLLLGWGIIPLVHIGEKFFKDPSLGFIAMYFVNVALGIIPQIALLLIDIFGHAEWVRELRDVLGKVFLLLPQFAFADGVLTITKNEIQAELLSRFGADTYISPLSWELLGINYVCLFVYGILAFIINLLIENKYTAFQNKKKPNFPMKSKYLLETVNLRKEFKCSDGIRVAVDSLSLKIPPGQCFGLLGVNGAGKSTTFKMLTTELTSTSGDILIEDESIGNGPLTSGKLGYCSQMNSMDPKLTVWQSLELYSKLKDISNINDEIHSSLELFGLTPYIDQQFENLSGGNKRKLCAAVAMLGNSPVILMDEPTSGMDPAARSLIAKAIDDVTRKNRSVILTSHSMEECEALCSEVAILIEGKIHCIGSPQSLKVRFGGGYLISIRLRQENQTYELNTLMSKHFPNSKIENQQYCTSQFLIPTNTTTLPSYIFNRMNLISRTLDITDYSIVRSTLDQVFINLVHSQSSNDLENNDIGSSTDGISMSSFTNKTYQQDNVTVSRL